MATVTFDTKDLYGKVVATQEIKVKQPGAKKEGKKKSDKDKKAD